MRPERRQNILVTDPARLILDLDTSERNPEVARRGLFSARKKKLVTWAALEECLEQHARAGRRRITGLRADLDLYRRTGCPETSFEDANRDLGPAPRRPGGGRAARPAGARQPGCTA